MRVNGSVDKGDVLCTHAKVVGSGGRLEFVDISKAFLIVLVVTGHFNPVVTNDVWNSIIKVIYSFHMPAFMCLSGLLFAYTSRCECYGRFVWRKVKRLMIPYLTASTFIIVAKLMMQCVVAVKNEVEAGALLEMWWYPRAAYHLWFVWVLLLMFLVAGVSACRWCRGLVGVLAMALWLAPVELPSAFCVSHLKNMAIFFMAGVWMQDSGVVRRMQEGEGRWTKCFRMWIVGLALSFVLLECLLFADVENGAVGFCVHRVLPFVGIGLVLCLAMVVGHRANERANSWLVYVGSMSFLIYLFHTCCSEFAKVLLIRMGITEADDFMTCAILVSLAGFFLPLLLGKLVVGRLKCLSFLLGQPFAGRANGHDH